MLSHRPQHCQLLKYCFFCLFTHTYPYFSVCVNLIRFTICYAQFFLQSRFVLVLNLLDSMPWKYMGKWRYSSTILDLGTRWRWVVSFISVTLYPRWKNPRYPLERRLGGPQIQSGLCGEEKNHALPGTEPVPSSPSLYRLSCPFSYVHIVVSPVVDPDERKSVPASTRYVWQAH
jgi:hypothetical protein